MDTKQFANRSKLVKEQYELTSEFYGLTPGFYTENSPAMIVKKIADLESKIDPTREAILKRIISLETRIDRITRVIAKDPANSEIAEELERLADLRVGTFREWMERLGAKVNEPTKTVATVPAEQMALIA